MALATLLQLKSVNGATGLRKEITQVMLWLVGLAPCLEARQLTGLSFVCAKTSSSITAPVWIRVPSQACIEGGTPGTA